MAQQPPMQAMDTFVATMTDGSDQLVTKGQVLPYAHELVQRDLKGSGTLFRPLDLGGGEDEAPPKSEPKTPAAKAEAPAKPPVKAEARTAPAGKAAARG